jgi:ABC-2 type transport system permease protein
MSDMRLAQVAVLAHRSMIQTLRQPEQVAPAFIFPLFILAINTGGLANATHLVSFPTHSYLTFALALTFMQGALFAMTSIGTSLARDVETGFLNRLALTRLTGLGLVAGVLAGAAALGLLETSVFLLVGLIAGASFAAGVGGVLVIVALSLLMAVGFGALGAFVALQTGSGEAVQGMFPLFFAFLFLSSMSLPRNLITVGWFREIATYNPISYLIEAIRSLLVIGWDAQALLLGFGIAAAILVGGLFGTTWALRSRLART